MRFYGNGVVWDAENDKRLCKFSRASRGEKGVFETDDRRTQAILIERGYACDDDALIARLDAMSVHHDEILDVATETITTAPVESAPPKSEPVTADLSAKELREIGKELGLLFPANMKKTDMADAINAKREAAK